MAPAAQLNGLVLIHELHMGPALHALHQLLDWAPAGAVQAGAMPCAADAKSHHHLLALGWGAGLVRAAPTRLLTTLPEAYRP